MSYKLTRLSARFVIYMFIGNESIRRTDVIKCILITT